VTAPLPFRRRRRTNQLEERYFRVTSPFPGGIITVIRSEIEGPHATKLQPDIYSIRSNVLARRRRDRVEAVNPQSSRLS
jgi:hypothetical protein